MRQDLGRPRDTPSLRNHRWCVPAALLHEPHETLEGLDVLREVGAQHGVLLWQSLRDVTLWAQDPPGRRGGLFRARAAQARVGWIMREGVAVSMRGPLLSIAEVLSDPVGADAAAIGAACLDLARHLEGSGAAYAATSFAQAAALACPADPVPALETGRHASRAGSHSRAETWFRRAIGLARRAQRWDLYAAALIELGDRYRLDEKEVRARAYYGKAVRTCRRHSIRARLRGQAFHGLFRLARQAGDHPQAAAMEREARRGYGSSSPLLLHQLAHETAAWWLEVGSPARAAVLLRTLAPLRTDPYLRLESTVLLAQAASSAGARRLFRSAWAHAWALVREIGELNVPPAWVAALGEAAIPPPHGGSSSTQSGDRQ